MLMPFSGSSRVGKSWCGDTDPERRISGLKQKDCLSVKPAASLKYLDIQQLYSDSRYALPKLSNSNAALNRSLQLGLHQDQLFGAHKKAPVRRDLPSPPSRHPHASLDSFTTRGSANV